jgi:type VI secretion system protein ImpL
MKWHTRRLPSKEHIQAVQELKILEEDIVAARNFIRKSNRKYFQNPKGTPIYLLLGPSSFGKTTILAQSGLGLFDVNRQRLKNVNPTKYCSFWFTEDEIYIDTEGTYTKPDIIKPRNDLIWQGFIKLLQKYFGKNCIFATLIVLDLPSIARDNDLLKKTLFSIRERIYEIASLTKNVNIQVIFTKCDRIMGFNSFFSNLDKEERSQPFGFSFREGKKNLINDFEIKFNKLLKNLNNRVVQNLQKSTRPDERSLIKMFPSQLSHLRKTLISVIEQIPYSNQIRLCGMYFTSSIQKGSQIDPIKDSVLNVLNLKEKPAYHLEANDNRSFFVEELFKKIKKQFSHQFNEATPKSGFNFKWVHSRLAHYIYLFLLIGSLIGTTMLITYNNYHENTRAIQHVYLALRTKNITNPNDLYALINQLEKKPASPWLKMGVNRTKPLHQTFIKLHRQLFIQNLTSQIEKYLFDVSSLNPINGQKLYNGLKIYLMFALPEKLDKISIKNWFTAYWTEIYAGDKERIVNSQEQLDFVFKRKFKTHLNKNLIDLTRNNLKKLPFPELAFLLLENNFINQNLIVSPTKSLPMMYTRQNFHNIHDDYIPSIVNNLPANDWVLGDYKLLQSGNLSEETIAAVRSYYIEQYVLAWKRVLHLDPKIEFKNLIEGAKQLHEISSLGNEPLINLLMLAKENLNIPNPPEKLITEIKEKLPELYLMDSKGLQTALDGLAVYINNMAQKQDESAAAFAEITNYVTNKPTQHPIATLKTFANTQPQLLQAYLQNLAKTTWQILFRSTYDHINNAWNQIIIPKYKNSFEHKYPVFKESKEDLSIEKFHEFFGPHGTIDEFFNEYIEPFVNITKTDWTWRDIDNQELNFPATFLEVFLRAALIQRMFYSTQTEKPKLDFTLTPINMTPSTHTFNLDIDGQKVTFANENKTTQSLTWPGPQPGSVSISFINDKGKYFTTRESGPWAWFRVLDKANVTSSNNTKEFELTFDLNGNAIKYSLTTPEAVNPFIPEIISNFRCRE